MRKVITWCLTWFCSIAVAAIEDYSIGVGQVELNPVVITVMGDAPNYHLVSFPVGSSFITPPAVFILPSNVDPDAMTLRVFDVTTSGFKVFVSEAQAEDNLVYPLINFEYFAIEPGEYSFNAGAVDIVVGTTTTSTVSSKAVGGNHDTVTYIPMGVSPFGVKPVVITELQTIENDDDLFNVSGEFLRNTEPFLELSQLIPTATNFQVSLERAETTTGSVTAAETVAWLAITDDADFTETADDAASVVIKAFDSADTITGNCTAVNNLPSAFSGGTPVYVGSQIKRDGGDGGWLRRCSSNVSSVTVQVEEDNVDGEQAHTTEQANFIAFSREFVLTNGGDGADLNMVVSSNSVPAQVLAPSLSYSLSPTVVNFSAIFGANFTQFTATPVVIPVATSQGNGDPAFVRVTNRSATGFTISQIIPQGTTVLADKMTVDFMAAVPGVHTLVDGLEIAAGIASVSDCVGSQAGCPAITDPVIAYGTSFTAPAVLAAVQEIDLGFDPEVSAEPLLATSITAVSGSNFRAAFEYAQTNGGSPLATAQDMGWIAMEGNTTGGLHAAEGTTNSGGHIVEIRTVVTPANVSGWDDGACDSNNFPLAFTLPASPLVIATHNTRNGGDGGWVRKCGQTAGAFTAVIDEDVAADTERSHGSSESLGAIAFSDTFAWTPATYSNMKLGSVFSDPVNGTSNPKAIPQAEVDYTVEIKAKSRIGIDENMVNVTDAIPANTQLFVGDLSGGCPIAIQANTAGLTFNCGSDLLLLSGVTPGGCTPDVGGYCPFSTYSFGGDWSADVTSIKVNPKGEFAGSTGVGVEPQFTFRFRVRLN
jgi:hypothetical protein